MTYHCISCGRDFEATPEEAAIGHLCLAMDQGLSQKEAIEQLQRVREFPSPRVPA